MQSPSLSLIVKTLHQLIEEELQRVGIQCRVFSRVKEYDSLREKVERKRQENEGRPYYTKEGKKIQDIVGIRIVTYFYEDVELLWNICAKMFTVVDTATAEITESNFQPLRKNMVCQMPNDQTQMLHEFINSVNDNIYEIIDSTFEIQFRTILSEGWHEVDHILRYKCKDDWKNLLQESRMFNGIYATLETSDKALEALFNDLAHNHYKNKNWSAMLRFKYKMHFSQGDLSHQLNTILNENHDFAKFLYLYNRHDLLEFMTLSGLKMMLSLNNLIYVIYLINRESDVCIRNEKLEEIIPKNIQNDISNSIIRFHHIKNNLYSAT